METRYKQLSRKRSFDREPKSSVARVIIAKGQMIRAFLRSHAEPHHVWNDSVLLKADIGVLLLLLDNSFPRQQDGARAHRTDEACEGRIVEMAQNNWLLPFQRQERPEVVYIHGVATKEYRPPTWANETGNS
jgi:hypothetical protein